MARVTAGRGGKNRRRAVRTRADAKAAAEEIIKERRRHSLGKTTIRELINDGRRG